VALAETFYVRLDYLCFTKMSWHSTNRARLTDSHRGSQHSYRSTLVSLITLSVSNSRNCSCPSLVHRFRDAEIFFLSGIRAIFLNFVTFSTKHGSISDKACVRLLGSRYVHANAHRRPWSRFWVFAGETSSLSFYIYRWMSPTVRPIAMSSDMLRWTSTIVV